MEDVTDIRLRTIQSTLDLERALAAEVLRQRDAAFELLRIGAAQYREYERHHLAKQPPDTAKAARNAQLAESYEALLKRSVTTTQGPV